MFIAGLISTKLVVYAQPPPTSRCPSLLINIQHHIKRSHWLSAMRARA